jgi:GNAT superfamily N-acetyltransferase
MALTHAAALRAPAPIVRAAMPGEGIAIAALWRELWDTHQAWGGYPGSRDDEVYARLAARLDDEAHVREGRSVLGSHAHLIAELDGAPAGQVEGWLERRGPGLFAPLICEVRSLVVTERARGFGVGRALLDTLAATSHAVAPEAGCVLAAEVLEPNPAHAFYARVGFTPVAWNAAIDPASGGRGEISTSAGLIARSAGALDASAVARLEGILSARRRAAGDLRFGPPPAIDSTLLSIVASHLAADAREQGDSATIVVVDRTGIVRGAASVILQLLDPPFLAVRRALVGRFALDPTFAPAALVRPLVAMGCRFAEARGAVRVELTDLTEPGTALHDAALATGALPWSRVVLRESAQPESPVPCPLPPQD